MPKLGPAHERKAAVELITGSGLAVSSLMATNPFTLDDRDRWPDQAETLSEVIDTAQALACDTVVLPFGRGGSMPWERSADALEEALGPSVREAQRQGIWCL